jgi:hypothetical protein
MLIFTSLALEPFALVPDWRGERVLVLRPADRVSDGNVARDLGSDETDLVVAEYLQPLTGVADLFADLCGWLKPRLERNEAPILYLDRPVDPVLLGALSEQGRVEAGRIHAEFSDDDRLCLLRVGEAIATSPLLPAFLSFLKDRNVSDRAFVTLFAETFDAA